MTHNLAYLKQRRKDFKSAKALYEKAIEIVSNSDVKNNPINQAILEDYNSLMKAMGRPEDKLTAIPVKGK